MKAAQTKIIAAQTSTNGAQTIETILMMFWWVGGELHSGQKSASI